MWPFKRKKQKIEITLKVDGPLNIHISGSLDGLKIHTERPGIDNSVKACGEFVEFSDESSDDSIFGINISGDLPTPAVGFGEDVEGLSTPPEDSSSSDDKAQGG